MEEKTITLIIGLAGIVSTLIASGLGFYYTAKARTSSLREVLFVKQFDLITRIISKQGRVRVFVTILAAKDNTYKEQAREDIGNCVKEFSEYQDEGAAILPTELWVEVKKINDYMASILISYDDGKDISEDDTKTLAAMITKICLLSRAVIGVDELTEESIELFSSKEEYEKLANIEIEDLKKISKQQ